MAGPRLTLICSNIQFTNSLVKIIFKIPGTAICAEFNSLSASSSKGAMYLENGGEGTRLESIKPN